MSYAYDYITSKQLHTEKDYPYRARDQSCKKAKGDKYTVSSYKILDPADVDTLSSELENGPVSVALEV
jgi:hypothetical protein